MMADGIGKWQTLVLVVIDCILRWASRPRL